ncbi:hypothetical protein ABID47_000126 [Paenibacillus favisporus]|uniref:Uncharacterized protein n=1 Tax=Paenibacillus favisporus TaxID=221028 RepID=A0ABV2EV79_9BACL
MERSKGKAAAAQQHCDGAAPQPHIFPPHPK